MIFYTKKPKMVFGVGAFFVFLVLCVVASHSVASSDFPTHAVISIEKNTTLTQAADLLKEKHVVRSAFLFKVYVVLFGDRKQIIAGDYKFDTPESAIKVAHRIAHGDFNLERIKVTIPEGTDVRDMAAIIAKNIPDFDAKQFFQDASSSEGYLFPDTYFLYENSDPQDALSLLRQTFDVKTKALSAQASTSEKSVNGKTPRTWKNVVIMASILEREGTSTVDREIISGILWKRLDEGMALQVDAPFWYLFRKGSKDLTLEDLKNNSPYNTYAHRGLPPTPISNPGIDSIEAALHPTMTKYWYYLSDPKGGMHYAVSLDEHAQNKRRYLR